MNGMCHCNKKCKKVSCYIKKLCKKYKNSHESIKITIENAKRKRYHKSIKQKNVERGEKNVKNFERVIS